ncbi:TonB-dependent receptor plug domain-containing protein [Porticoccaceae bacterium]|nr:TonB-dependent receptor plug domain-containing protein [Porticoccaceae bacterium]
MQQFIIVVAFSFAVNFVLSPHSMADIDQPELQFNIPSQSLESGLVAFSLQADINIIGTTELLRQHVIPDINGYFTRTEVLAILLQGSGLQYKIIDNTAVSISPDTGIVDDTYLQEIIVTAAGRATDLQKTPIAVSVFDQIRLDASGVSNLGELAYMVPGLEMTSTAPQAAMLVQLRGVGTTNITEIADGPVSIHVDGIYSPRSQAAAALLYDIDRIEVLRGPQGTLLGRNSTSGSVNIYNHRPSLDGVDGHWSTIFGNYNRREFRGAIDLPIHKTFGLRIAGATLKHNSYTDLLDNYIGLGAHYPTDIADLTDYDQAVDYGQKGPEMADQQSWRISSLWQPAESFSALTSVEKYRDQGSGIAQLDPSLVTQGIRAVVSDSPSFLDLSNETWRNQLDYQASTYSVRYLYGRSTMTRQQIVDADFGRSSSFEQQRTHSSNFQFSSHELQLMNADTERLRWVLGTFYSREKNSIVFAVDQQNAGGGRYSEGASSWISNADGGAVSYAIQPNRRVESLGVFAQATYDIDQYRRITLGARHTKDTKSDRGGRAINCRVTSFLGPYVDSSSIGPGAPNPEDIYADAATQHAINRGAYHDNGTKQGIGNEPCWIRQVNDLSVTWKNVSGLVNFEFSPSDRIMYFASLSTGFKSGHIQDAGNAVEPETVTNFELGFKSQYLDNRLRFNLAMFQAKYNNLQFSNEDRLDINNDGIADTGGSTVVRNASAATIRGLELELDWALTDADRLQISAAVTDAQFDRFEIPDTLFGDLFNPFVAHASLSPQDPVVLSGNSPPRLPNWKLTLAYSHDFIFDWGVATPRVVIKASDKYFLDIYNRDRVAAGVFARLPNGGTDVGVQRPYQMLDLNLTFKPTSTKWTVTAFINNATDKAVKVDSGNVITESGLVATYLAPRTYGVKFSYLFARH